MRFGIRKMLLKFLLPGSAAEARELGTRFGATCNEDSLAGFLAGLVMEVHNRPEEDLPLGKRTRQYVTMFAMTTLATREARRARGG